MNRRSFLSASAAAVGLAAAQEHRPQQTSQQPAYTPADAQQAPGFHAPHFELDELSVADLQSRLKHGSLTIERIAELYLDRIADVDRRGPALRSLLETNPEVLDLARALDREYKSKGPRTPLHGMPVLLKDNIDTGDKMLTTAGSLALLDAPTPADAFLVQRLRAAGALILGKTNLSEWANFRSTRSTSGWSARGGQTKNPYALDRNPCGSSSGSGAAISANLAMFAVGTETDGSIVCPSSMCGIVGIKPTLGLISRTGIIPIAHSQDTAGPMARTVRDAAILLGALAGPDPRDPATQSPSAKFYTDYTRFLDPNGLRSARLGIARQYFKIGPAVTALMNESLDLLRHAGAQIIDPADLPTFETWRETETEALLYEFKADLNRYLARRGARIKSMQDCIAFNRAHAAQEMPFFEQELMELAQEKGPLSDSDYKQAQATNRRLTRIEGIDAVLAKFKLDAIVAPTAGAAWLTDWIDGDHADSGCASPPAVAGYPHITVPAGFKFGLPLGISFFGAPWSEPKLLRIAYGFEQTRRARRKPEFLPTINFYG